jgi:hypothetical protein
MNRSSLVVRKLGNQARRLRRPGPAPDSEGRAIRQFPRLVTTRKIVEAEQLIRRNPFKASMPARNRKCPVG